MCVFICSQFAFCQTQIINTSTTEGLNYLSIIDSNIIIGGKGNYIAKSYDECNNLNFINSPALPGAWSRFHRIDTNSMFIFSRAGNLTTIYKSVDGGNNWVEKLNTDTVIGEEFTMFDSLEGILLCYAGECLRTMDGGDTWMKENGLAFSHSGIGTKGDSTVISGNGAIFLSRNRGLNWTYTGSIGNYQKRYFFIDTQTIFALSTNNIDQYFSFTLNAGTKWTTRTIPNAPYFNPYGIYFLNLNEGYLVGTSSDNNFNGVIYKTVDTGLTWTIYNTYLPSLFSEIEFLNDSVAFISGTNGTLIKWNKHSWATEVINIEKEVYINLYPNPSNNIQNIEIIDKKVEPLVIELFDTSGRKIADVFKGTSKIGKSNIKYNLAHIPKGIYQYRIQIGQINQYLKTSKTN